VVFFGIIMCIVFIVPFGMIKATTGMMISTDILSEFMGGALVPGNALALNFFKIYGYFNSRYQKTDGDVTDKAGIQHQYNPADFEFRRFLEARTLCKGKRARHVLHSLGQLTQVG
jgi:hypothetical protein